MNTKTSEQLKESATPDRILRRIDWHVVRRLDGTLQGDYSSLFFGDCMELAELREYQTEDDIRSIDWNVTARMNAPYVRRYIEDREITAWFLLDLSPSMAFGAQERPKGTVMLEFMATLAHLLTRNGNRVGAVFYNNTVEQLVPPRSGRAQVLRLINDMLKREPSSGGSMTDLTPLLESAINAIKRRSLVFLVSDFKRYAVHYSSLSLIREAGPGRSRWRRHLPFALFLLALASLVLALGRPVTTRSVTSSQSAIVLALDVSLSMCSSDIAPNRLTVAQESAEAFIRNQDKNTRIGLVTFAGFAELIVPPTGRQGGATAGRARPDNRLPHRGRQRNRALP